MEGLFFLLIGVVISSLIEVFVSRETFEKFIPKNSFYGVIAASFTGLIFPTCECAIVPIVHRLIKKGVPLNICVTVLFSAPIVNVVVLSSTYFAFPEVPLMALYRFLGGIFISIIMGLIVHKVFDTDNAIEQKPVEYKIMDCGCSSNVLTSCCSDHNHEGSEKSVKLSDKIHSVFRHSIDEFFETGKYFIMGILIAALIQSTVPRSELAELGASFPESNMFMMFFSYVLSVCSNTDAFIARSFIQEFNLSSLLGFMVFGAMFDIKTTIMMRKIFKKTFILKLLFHIFIISLIYTSVIELFVTGGR